jgi:hypothetical protein
MSTTVHVACRGVGENEKLARRVSIHPCAMQPGKWIRSVYESISSKGLLLRALKCPNDPSDNRNIFKHQTDATLGIYRPSWRREYFCMKVRRTESDRLLAKQGAWYSSTRTIPGLHFSDGWQIGLCPRSASLTLLKSKSSLKLLLFDDSFNFLPPLWLSLFLEYHFKDCLRSVSVEHDKPVQVLFSIQQSSCEQI